MIEVAAVELESNVARGVNMSNHGEEDAVRSPVWEERFCLIDQNTHAVQCIDSVIGITCYCHSFYSCALGAVIVAFSIF